MKTEYIPIKEEQRLSEILPEIPTNTILHKKLTGCGATYGEIRNKTRNSIIIEPNVPVIVGKCNNPTHKDDNLIGVYEGVYKDDVIRKIGELRKGEYFKILSTPESFHKVKDALEELDIDLYYDCFMLLDESHKSIKDIDYRSDISAPFDDFFKCQNKALVSATPIDFSDPRFESFNVIEVKPTFDNKQHIHLYHTNNVLQSLKSVIRSVNDISSGTICLFVNSTDMIYDIMNKLDILNDSVVFCAPKSVDRLREKNFRQAYKEWQPDKIKKYNFFTSRFNCALDVEMDVQPDVIMVTDLYFAEYSMIDPYADAIQIIGRFRNGISSIHHISNTNKDLPVRSKAELKESMNIMKVIYNEFQTRYNYATDVVRREVFWDTLQCLQYNKYLDKRREKNWNMIDNFIDESLLKGQYQSVENLCSAYNELFYITLYKDNCYLLNDQDRLRREDKTLTYKAKRRIVVEQLEQLNGYGMETVLAYKDELRSADAFIVEAYELIGKDEIERLNYSRKKIKEAMILKQYEIDITGTEFIDLIQNSFIVGRKYTLKFIKEELIRIYELLGTQPRKTIKATLIGDFYEIKECWIGKNRDRGYLLVRSKF